MQEFSGYEYLLIDIANTYGLDKEIWNDRLTWAKDNIKDLEALSNEANDIPLFNKAVAALRKVERKEPTGHIMFLDATASGIQVLAALSGCEKSANAVNLINTGKREDVYQSITDACNKLLPNDQQLVRADLKKPIMTHFYNAIKAVINTLGEDTPALNAFYNAVQTQLTGADDARLFINQFWNPHATHHIWTLPDNHTSYCPVVDTVDERISLSEIGSSFTHRAKIFQPTDKYLSLAPNIVHSIDAWILRQMIIRLNSIGVKIITVHDAYGCNPNDGNIIRLVYRQLLTELAESNLLSDILSEIAGYKVYYRKQTTNLHTKIAKCEYALS